jgi:hypothetical protein
MVTAGREHVRVLFEYRRLGAGGDPLEPALGDVGFAIRVALVAGVVLAIGSVLAVGAVLTIAAGSAAAQ